MNPCGCQSCDCDFTWVKIPVLGVGASILATVSTDPDALYSIALSKVNRDTPPELSDVSKKILDAGIKIVGDAIGPALNKLSGEALGTILSAIPSQTLNQMIGIVGAVASAVESMVPMIGMVVNFFTAGFSSAQAFAASQASQWDAQAREVLNRPTPGSFGGLITPADIFANDPNFIPGNPNYAAKFLSGGYDYMPSTPFGILLAAITEDAGIYGWADSNLHHLSDWVDRSKNWYLQHLHFLGMDGQGYNVGIPKNRRAIYQSLRRAMGSYNSDQGKSLWPIYMDMLAADFKSGALTSDYATWLVTHVNGFDGDELPDSLSGSPYNNGNPVSTDAAFANANFAGYAAAHGKGGEAGYLGDWLKWSEIEVKPWIDQIEKMALTWNPPPLNLAINPSLMRSLAVAPPKQLNLLNTMSVARVALKPAVNSEVAPAIAGTIAGALLYFLL